LPLFEKLSVDVLGCGGVGVTLSSESVSGGIDRFGIAKKIDKQRHIKTSTQLQNIHTPTLQHIFSKICIFSPIFAL